jgi:hypothetical protein
MVRFPRKFYPPTPPTGDVVADDVPCATCGYNLRGLRGHGECPECAWFIANSLGTHRRDVAWRAGFERDAERMRDLPGVYLLPAVFVLAGLLILALTGDGAVPNRVVRALLVTSAVVFFVAAAIVLADKTRHDVRRWWRSRP